MKSFLIIVLSFALFDVSCAQSDRQAFSVDTSSPKGTYRVRLDGGIKPSNSLPGEFYLHTVKLTALIGKNVEIIDEKFYQGDPYEPAFLDAFPVLKWTNDSTLRLGSNVSQPFYDMIIVSNNTGVRLDMLVVQYGKYENFLIFDVAPGDKFSLQASPQFDKEVNASTIGYKAYANGNFIRGYAGELRQRKLQDGPLNQSIEVSGRLN